MGKVEQYNGLVEQIVTLVQQSKQQVARSVNQTITLTYWQIGRYIVEFEQTGEKRAKYGKELLENLARDLTKKFGRGFSYRNINLFRQFYLTFPILQSVIAESKNPIVQSPFAQLKDEILQTPSAEFKEKIWQTPSAKSETSLNPDLFQQLSWSHFVRLLSIKSEEERVYYLKKL